MARYALISGGKVSNVVEADQDWIDAHAPGAVLLPDGSRVGPGWTHAGGSSFTAPTPVVAVPQAITRRQARQALVLNGYTLASIDALIESLPEPKRSIARIFWQDSNDFERQNATLKELSTALGISAEQLDTLFIAAAQL